MQEESLGSEVDGLFWPGFVDAVSCLVLNLLFLTMVLTIAVFVLAQGQALQRQQMPVRDTPGNVMVVSPSQQFDVSVTAPAPAPARTLAKPSQPSRPSLFLPPEIDPQANGEVRVDEDSSVEAQLVVIFNSATVIVPQAQRDALVARLRELEALQPGHAYEVRVATDITLSDARRNAYFRAVSMRDLMMAAGIRPLAITLRMENKKAVDGEGAVRIYRRNDLKEAGP